MDIDMDYSDDWIIGWATLLEALLYIRRNASLCGWESLSVAP